MFNEMKMNDQVREPYRALVDWMDATGPEILAQKRLEAETLFRKIGITFAVYGEGGDPERLIPFDLIPRIFTATEWRKLERGVKQRARALNTFLYDVYHNAPPSSALIPPAVSIATLWAWMWCVLAPMNFMCWKITAARHRAFPTCWKTAKS